MSGHQNMIKFHFYKFIISIINVSVNNDINNIMIKHKTVGDKLAIGFPFSVGLGSPLLIIKSLHTSFNTIYICLFNGKV